jgi:hypothetical protein
MTHRTVEVTLGGTTKCIPLEGITTLDEFNQLARDPAIGWAASALEGEFYEFGQRNKTITAENFEFILNGEIPALAIGPTQHSRDFTQVGRGWW